MRTSREIKSSMDNTLIGKNEIEKLASVFGSKNAELYLVGGAVRDYWLGLEPHDIDFATNLTPSEIKSLLKENGIFFTNVGEKYGTIVAHLNGQEFEITTYRKDIGSADGRHPDGVSFAPCIEDDLSRRDFTMNAMAMNPNTLVIKDPFGGMADLNKKNLHFVGDTKERITEDALRIVRAVRFAIKYGLTISPEDVEILRESASLLKNVSWERKGQELAKILTQGKPIKDIFMAMPEVLFQLVPELADCKDCTQKNIYHKHDVLEHILSVTDAVQSSKFEIKMAALLHDIGKPSVKTTDSEGYEHFSGHPEVSTSLATIAMQRLKYTAKECKDVCTLVSIHDNNFFQTEKQLKRAIFKYGENTLHDLVILQKADLSDHIIPKDMPEHKRRAWFTPQSKIDEMFESIHMQDLILTAKDLALKGGDLLSMGYKGKEIGEAQNRLLEAVLDEQVENSKEALIDFLSRENEEELEF